MFVTKIHQSSEILNHNNSYCELQNTGINVNPPGTAGNPNQHTKDTLAGEPGA